MTSRRCPRRLVVIDGALSVHHEEEGEIGEKGWRVGDEAAL